MLHVNNLLARGRSQQLPDFSFSAEGKYVCMKTSCSREAHRDYVVQRAWMLNMMAMRKMSVEAARNHFVRTSRDVPRLGACIEAYVEECRPIGQEKQVKGPVT